jgi:hypothetical protein
MHSISSFLYSASLYIRANLFNDYLVSRWGSPRSCLKQSKAYFSYSRASCNSLNCSPFLVIFLIAMKIYDWNDLSLANSIEVTP